MSSYQTENDYVSLVIIPRKWFKAFYWFFLVIVVGNGIVELFTNWSYKGLGETFLTRTAVLMTLTVGSFFIVSHILEGVTMLMLGSVKAFKDKIRAEGKAEGKAERDAEWIEWTENGRDPNKMPSVINPTRTIYEHNSKGKTIKTDKE